MNVNSLVINALSPLVSDVEPDNYKGDATTYITFNYSDDRAVEFADDIPIMDMAYLQIHLFCPEKFNFQTLKKQIRSRLFGAGFSYPQISSFYEDESKTNHIIFECSIEGQSETEE